MVDGRLSFVWLNSGINIWDTDEGKLIQKVDVDWSSSGGLRISGNMSKVSLQTGKFTQAWSIQSGEAPGEVEVGDGLRIWIHPKDRPTQG